MAKADTQVTPDSEEFWDGVPTVDAGHGEVFKFENIGDVFIGTYKGAVQIDTETQGELEAHAFTEYGTDLPRIIWASYDLNAKLTSDEIQEGNLCRIEYVKDIQTSRGQTPMKSFRVQAKF